MTLTGGSIVDGTLNVASTLDLYSGTISANITGSAALDKLGSGTVLLVGDNTNSGGDNALNGTLIVASASPVAGTRPGEWPRRRGRRAHALLVRQRRLDDRHVGTGRRHADPLDRRQQRGHCRRLDHPD